MIPRLCGSQTTSTVTTFDSIDTILLTVQSSGPRSHVLARKMESTSSTDHCTQTSLSNSANGSLHVTLYVSLVHSPLKSPGSVKSFLRVESKGQSSQGVGVQLMHTSSSLHPKKLINKIKAVKLTQRFIAISPKNGIKISECLLFHTPRRGYPQS